MKKRMDKTPVKKYILEAIDFDGYDAALPQSTDAEKLQSLDKIFRQEYGYLIPRIGYTGAMCEWIQGLPSAFDIEYRNSEIIALAKLWKSIPENATEKQEEKIINNFFRFIATITTQMIEKAVK